MASGHVVKVRSEKIMACMTCPLCNKLLKEATTISLCLHTFCRKCIYEKLSDEDNDSCPVCDINLGCIPVDKLRPDHNLQDIRSKIFPLKRRKVEAPEITPASLPPAKRKERSLSSLVVSAPTVSVQGGVTGRRTRGRKGYASRGASPATEETSKKEEYSVDNSMDGSSSPETLNRIIQNKKQSSSAKSSNDQIRREHTEKDIEGRDGKLNLWRPLNTLLEAANRSKFSKPGPQGESHLKTDPTNYGEADVCVNKIKSEENGHGVEVQGEMSRMPMPSLPIKRRRRRQSNKNKLSGSAESSSPALILKAASRDWRDGPIWFSLVASLDQEGVEPLPQVSAAFLRVKDASQPVSFIQKYLMKKLELTSEEEQVQVMCHGQAVMPHLKLSSLVDLWLRTSSTPKKVKTFVGGSAKDFVMVLSYSRKVASSS
ncbi:E3 ubiquitin protein ligase DRIP2-like isoform X1 [Silene latifolia]|uniref:E3 ubiquitin protein ligase DRIP2-like isoform X1 n=1 Tax=Silene latifolia TaxID=37657 RepID=UPI003D76C4E4